MTLPDQVKNAFGFLDVMFFWLPQWGMIKDVILKSVIIAEVAAKYGAGLEKREKVVEAVYNEVHAFVPAWMRGFVEWAIGVAVDQVVNFLNTTFGKDWIKFILGGENNGGV